MPFYKTKWLMVLAVVVVIVAAGFTVRYFQVAGKIKKECSVVSKYQPFVAAQEKTANWPDCQKELAPYGISSSAACHDAVAGQEEKTYAVQASTEEYNACLQRRGL